MSLRNALASRMSPALKTRLQDFRTARNATHIHGPRTVQLSPEEVVVTCVVRNGEYYIRSFIEHYLHIGCRHIFFLDNGSTDKTLEIAGSYDRVSTFSSTLPISKHQRLLKRYLSAGAGPGGWCLDADIDEFFDYPMSENIKLPALLHYLNEHRFTAVITQLLDMFSGNPLASLTSEREENIQATYRFYDLSDVTKTDYSTSELTQRFGASNKLGYSHAALCWGGMRKTLYGNNCLLTKHSLFRPCAGVELFPHVHFVNGANLADVSAVMMHYKLTSNALTSTLQNRDNFVQNGESYDAFLNVLKNDPQQELTRATTRAYREAGDLVRERFLFMSGRYQQYAEAALTASSRALPSHKGLSN
jgi:hypothetical protein